eukprot:jgi/Ulvmu1/11410/UM075_0072.1
MKVGWIARAELAEALPALAHLTELRMLNCVLPKDLQAFTDALAAAPTPAAVRPQLRLVCSWYLLKGTDSSAAPGLGWFLRLQTTLAAERNVQLEAADHDWCS